MTVRRKHLILLICFFLTISIPPALCEAPETGLVEDMLNRMTLHEKICQMIVVTPEFFSDSERVLTAEDGMEAKFSDDPFGGILIRGRNIATETQAAELNNAFRSLIPMPFVIVNEESPAVGTLSLKLQEDLPPDASSVPKGGWYRYTSETAKRLRALGFSMNLAPVADLALSSANEEMNGRCVSSGAGDTAAYTAQAVQAYLSEGIISAVKHFPGEGRAESPVSQTQVRIRASGKKLYENDLMPFRMAIAAGVPCVMMSGAVYEALDDGTPACFSSIIIQELLRGELGFDGVVITPVLDADAFTEQYSAKETVRLAIQSGADLLLLPPRQDKAAGYIENAVLSGEISEDRIDESVRRILNLKEQYGLLR